VTTRTPRPAPVDAPSLVAPEVESSPEDARALAARIVPAEAAPTALWLLTKAMVLRTKLAEVLERAAALPPEALARAEAEAPPPTVEYILAQAEVLRTRVIAARAQAEDLAAAEQRAEILEQAIELSRAIDEVRERLEWATTAAARAELLARLEELHAECKNALARVRLVPEVITA